MDPDEKKRIANEKRFKAVKEWKKNRTVQNIIPINTRIVFDENVKDTSSKSDKPKLFEASDDEEEKYEESFKIQPQFDGPHGQELLEMSSKFSGRFKLDERFREDEPEPQESRDEKEKEKNLKILQNILGFSVSSKTPDKHQSRKRQIRFDPEDENASKYMKITETPVEKPNKKKKRNVEEKNEPDIPISAERYVEVSSNLKDILSAPSAGFSLTQKFDLDVDEELPFHRESNMDEILGDPVNKVIKRNQEGREEKRNATNQESGSRYFVPRMKNDSFFFKEGDPRLKEGIEFFKRLKPMEKLREDWSNKKDYVMRQFRQKKRSSLRSHAPKVKTTQIKNAIRKQNWKK